MTTTAIAAPTAILILLSPFSRVISKWLSQDGSLWDPTTLSRTTFRGHGAARLITVWTTIAARMMQRLPRYGRISSRTKRSNLATPGSARRDEPTNVATNCKRFGPLGEAFRAGQEPTARFWPAQEQLRPRSLSGTADHRRSWLSFSARSRRDTL